MNNITLNGQQISSSHDNILALLDSYELTKGRYAVEVDGTLIPKSKLGHTHLRDGMVIEVVQAVGGG